MTFKDEVEVAHRQLEIIGTKNENNDLVPSQQWRDRCSHILGKTKKNLSDVFLVAALPEDGYQSFLEMCRKYEKGLLKDQRAMAKDLQEKPRFKPSYIKCLFGLDVSDRVALLGQVKIFLPFLGVRCPLAYFFASNVFQRILNISKLVIFRIY
ncbi:uncharacterized protein LOC114542482 [Dendronephthya gigantea]|uniref:uncharacterized protein LOC114542482 n=1 Tax=Dendronephthya gigantea TaxID=151771 RepID=UPI001069352E|nr:uncharacterized protein LOC114542482 [Dendronephthya gigantea]